MACELEQATADQLWPALLEFRAFSLTPQADETECVFLSRRGGVWRFDSTDPRGEPGTAQTLLVPLRDTFDDIDLDEVGKSRGVSEFRFSRFANGDAPLRHLRGEPLEDRVATMFRVYLPLLLGALRARRRGEVFVIAHVAQTLDGRIACCNGHSQWISNEANLVHSHRLRALHDAVLVGGRTVAHDDPQLTVRHVAGEDPRRIVLSGSGSVLRTTRSFQVFGDAGSTVLCSDRALAAGLPEAPNNVHVLPVPTRNGGAIAAADACSVLAAQGVRSLFLEGGGATLSSFLDDRCIDVLHVHIAPVILGSGVSSFALPEVATVQEGRQFRMKHFTLDGEVLLECRVLQRPESPPPESQPPAQHG